MNTIANDLELTFNDMKKMAGKFASDAKNIKTILGVT